MAASYDDLNTLQKTYLVYGDEKVDDCADDDDLFPAPCTEKGCTMLNHYKTQPFAAGAFRYAYRARYCNGAIQDGKKKGGKCVVKKWKHKHIFEQNFWKRDLKMSETACQLANGWNKLGKVSKKLIVLKPLLAHSVAKNTDPKNVKEIQTNEYTMNEDYLDGKFAKWNSNSGWVSNEHAKSSIQAFCHWTYHYTDGNFLFCDAQGVKKQNEYLITDPCILSNKAGRFGSSDCGNDYILNWFLNHKCNQFCDKKWLKPNQKPTIKINALKRTTFAFETVEYTKNIVGATKSGITSKFNAQALIKEMDNIYE